MLLFYTYINFALIEFILNLLYLFKDYKKQRTYFSRFQNDKDHFLICKTLIFFSKNSRVGIYDLMIFLFLVNIFLKMYEISARCIALNPIPTTLFFIMQSKYLSIFQVTMYFYLRNVPNIWDTTFWIKFEFDI